MTWGPAPSIHTLPAGRSSEHLLPLIARPRVCVCPPVRPGAAGTGPGPTHLIPHVPSPRMEVFPGTYLPLLLSVQIPPSLPRAASIHRLPEVTSGGADPARLCESLEASGFHTLLCDCVSVWGVRVSSPSGAASLSQAHFPSRNSRHLRVLILPGSRRGGQEGTGPWGPAGHGGPGLPGSEGSAEREGSPV